MVNQEVIVNNQMQEKIFYRNPDFPMARFLDQFDYFADGGYLCHWHPEFEFAVVLQGRIEFQLDQQVFTIEAGDGIFINSQVLHSARQLCPSSLLFNIEFPANLFNTVATSSLYQKYFRPSSTKKAIGYAISHKTPEGEILLNQLRAIHALDPNCFTYELICMESIFSIWRNLLALLNQSGEAEPQSEDIRREHRTRKMLTFIQSHFSEQLSIEDIAAAANVSRSECFRCFSDFCHCAPIEYVNQYRVHFAAQKLTDTDESVSEICYACGFSSTSYFSRAFRKIYGVSPSDFRKDGGINGKSFN